MFNKHSDEGSHHRKKGLGITGIFRLLLSLMIILILLGGVYAAFTAFSPRTETQNGQVITLAEITQNPKGFFKNLLTSDGVYHFITGILSFNPSSVVTPPTPINTPGNQNIIKNDVLMYRFAVVSDSHNDSLNLSKALKQAKQSDAKFVIGLGDYTEVGTSSELQLAKTEFDLSGLTLYSTAGDHDLWDSRDKNLPAQQNYTTVFGSPYQSFIYQNTRFILIYNSDNYLGIDDVQKKWIQDELNRKTDNQQLTFIFAGIPLYHPTSDHVMGKVTPTLRPQAQELINLFKEKTVSEVITGDIHAYSSYTEPQTSLKMTTVGAVTSSRNLQTPRFVLVDVYQNGSYNIQDIEIK